MPPKSKGGVITPGLAMLAEGRVGVGLEFDFESDNPTPPGLIVRNEENNQVRFDTLTLMGCARKAADDLGKKGSKNAEYLLILNSAIQMSQKQYYESKEREAKALAMGREYDFDCEFDEPWNSIAVDLVCRYTCRNRQLPSGLPKIKLGGDSSSDEEHEAHRLTVMDVRVYGFSVDKVCLNMSHAIAFGTCTSREFAVTVDGNEADVLSASQTASSVSPGWIELELNALWLTSENAVTVQYKKPSDSGKRLACSEVISSILESTPSPIRALNCVSNLHMVAATVESATVLVVTLSGAIERGEVDADDFAVSFGVSSGGEEVPQTPTPPHCNPIPTAL